MNIFCFLPSLLCVCAEDYRAIIERMRQELSASIDMEKALAKKQVERVGESDDSLPVVEVVSTISTTKVSRLKETTTVRTPVKTTSMLSTSTETTEPVLETTSEVAEPDSRSWMEEAVMLLTTSTPPPLLTTLKDLLTSPSTGTVLKTMEVKKIVFLLLLFGVNFSTSSPKFYYSTKIKNNIPIVNIKYN